MTTALSRKIKSLIHAAGPLSVTDYFALCLADPEHGYYKTRDPFGARGDFVTAPEVSQLFGEIVGIFLVHAWQQHGMPLAAQLIEIGPGRGTMMSDILRVIARLAPGLYANLGVYLVETSPHLTEIQKKTLAAHAPRVEWVTDFSEVPEGFTLLVANELFDAIPIRQYVKTPSGFRERLVGLMPTGELGFVTGAGTLDPALLPAGADHAPDGTVFEVAPARGAVMQTMAERIAASGGTALVIDYGHLATGFGDTLQALKAHEYDPVLAHPGEADLTSHVDFEHLAGVAQAAGLAVSGLARQGDFLLGLGLRERAAALVRGKDEETQHAVALAVARLSGEGNGNMGELFKVLAVSSPDVALAPFRAPGA